MTRAVQLVAIIAAFLLALAVAPLALGLGALWLAWRLAVYVTAVPAHADIVDWVGEGSPDDLERALAYPRLTFTSRDGVTRVFTSRLGYNIYDDPPPQGALAIRYHLSPRFSADIDDKAHWFTAPALTIAAALLGSFLAGIWRTIAGPLLGL